MADIWLPGWTRHVFNLRGKPYQYTHNPKGCLHTTEGGSIAGALGAYQPYPPHGIYDWRSREKLQHIALNYASYSAMDGNDDDYLAQIELVGFAAESRNWPEQAWRNIAEDVVKPLEDHFGIPRNVIWHGFKDGRDGMVLARADSPIRLNWAQLRDFSGWLGHQHLPSPDTHWDPGAIRMDRIFSYLSEEDDMAGEGPEILALLRNLDNWLLKGGPGPDAVYAGKPTAGLGRSSAVAVLHDNNKALRAVYELTGKPIGAVLVELLNRDPADLDEAAVAAALLPALTAAVDRLADVELDRVAQAVADEQDRRARDNDPTTGPTS